MGVGIGRLAAPSRAQVPAYSLAGMLGGLLPDGDSWLALLGPNMYGKYHRVITHSIVGLIVCGIAAGAIAWYVARARRTRRFGWFVTENLKDADVVGLNFSVPRLIAVGMCGAVMHWVMDWITGFGNLKPFWPWAENEYFLGAVYSFDWFIFFLTLGWHVAMRTMGLSGRKEVAVAACYFVAVAIYVFARWMAGAHTVW